MSSVSKEQFIRDTGHRIRVLRLHVGLSESEMAARLVLSIRAYRRWESGKRRSTRGWARSLVKMGEQFNVSIDWLVTGKKGDLPRDDSHPITPAMLPLDLGAPFLAGGAP